MKYATLGNTGLLVSKVCFGTMTLGDGRGMFKAIGAVGQTEADELIKTSIDSGINFFDTADVYTEGESEKILGQSLKNLNIARQHVVIATKVYGRVGPGRNDIGASRGHIMDGVEASLRRLQTDHIDLYQIHGNDSVTPVEETLRALDTLVQQGKVRYIGCSNWQAWKIAKALGISRVQEPGAIRYAAGLLLDRRSRSGTGNRTPAGIRKARAAGVESACRRSCFPASSAGQSEACGFAPHRLRLPCRGQRARLEDPRCDGSDREGTRVQPRTCLAGLAAGETGGYLGHHRRETPRPAAGQSRRGGTHAPAGEIKRLDEVSALPPEYPGWMLPFQGADRLEPVDRFKNLRQGSK